MGVASAIGHLTRGLRAGEDSLILNQAEFIGVPNTIEVGSPAFADRQPIPVRFTISGEDVSPPLEWSKLPSGTRDLVLIVEDYDVPMPHPMVHVIAYSLGALGMALAEGALPSRNAPALHPTARLGRNGMGKERYDGPAALPGHGPHHYVFQFFAVSKALNFETAPDKNEILEAIHHHVLATGRLTGIFERP